MASLVVLQSHLAGLGRVLLGFSGGVDSALLAVAARRALPREDLLAVIGQSASLPGTQHRAALGLARQFDIPLLELATAELDDPRYQANSTQRCYFCKQELWSRLGAVAKERGFSVIVDGTNADDLQEHRPGLGAAREWGVRSPLAELGWTKTMVRGAAREAGIGGWDAPASPCLSSRIQYGLAVTRERLGQVEAAESLLRAEGASGDLRVRHRGTSASVEVAPEMLSRVRARWDIVVAGLEALGFQQVDLDPRGYRRGSLLVSLSGAPVLTGESHR